MTKKKHRKQAYKPLHKRKTNKGNTPKRQLSEQMLVTIKDYDKYKPFIDELKRRGITPENFREHMAEVEELVPPLEQCRKGVGK